MRRQNERVTPRRTWLAGFASALGAAVAATLSSGCGEAVTVYLVRHAEKAPPEPGQAPSKDPPLSERGQQRALTLERTLEYASLDDVFATEFKRTYDTVAPTAAAHGVPVSVVPADDVAELVRRIRARTRGEVLVAGHSNTVPAIAAALGVTEPLALGDDDYGDLFVVTSRASGATIERRRFEAT